MFRDGNFLNAFAEKTIITIMFPNKPNKIIKPLVMKFKVIEYILRTNNFQKEFIYKTYFFIFCEFQF